MKLTVGQVAIKYLPETTISIPKDAKVITAIPRVDENRIDIVYLGSGDEGKAKKIKIHVLCARHVITGYKRDEVVFVAAFIESKSKIPFFIFLTGEPNGGTD